MRGVLDLIPDEWLDGEVVRSAYAEYFSARLAKPRDWVSALERPVPKPFEYALIRVVPRPEREEFINAGVVLYCPAPRFLDARFHLDPGRLHALDPMLDPKAVLAHLKAVRAICAGDPGGGFIGRLPPGERFGWLVAPRSTVVQTSPVHTGLTEDPERALDHLVKVMVLPPD